MTEGEKAEKTQPGVPADENRKAPEPQRTARPRPARAAGAAPAPDGEGGVAAAPAAGSAPAAAGPVAAAAQGRPKATIQRDPEATRRYFLRWLMWGSALLFFAQSALASLAMFWPRRVTGFGSKIVAGSVHDFPVGSVTRFRDGKFWLSRLDDGFIALYWRCTHLGCTVPWREDEQLFHCPCHGSMYERTGQNIAGPAPRPLDYMAVEIVNGQVVVNTGDIRERARHLPEHVTRV